MNAFAEGGRIKIGGVFYGLLMFDESQALGQEVTVMNTSVLPGSSGESSDE